MTQSLWKYIPPYESWLKYLPMGNTCTGVYKIYGFTAFIFIAYVFFLHITKTNDFMNKKIIKCDMFGKGCCSSWPISHFILYMILGMLFPDCVLLVIVIGIIWEVIEEMIGYIERKTGYKIENTLSSDKTQYSGTWCRGNPYDILFNIAGFYFGKFIVTMKGKPFCINGLNC